MLRHEHRHQHPSAPPGTEIAEQPPEVFHTVDPVGQFAQAAHRLTEIVGELRGLVLNNVLLSQAIVLDATGIFTVSFEVPFASVAIWNTTAGAATAEAGPPQGAAPTSGRATFRIGGNRWACFPVTGNQLTVYGAATSVLDLAVFNRLMPPGGGQA